MRWEALSGAQAVEGQPNGASWYLQTTAGDDEKEREAKNSLLPFRLQGLPVPSSAIQLALHHTSQNPRSAFVPAVLVRTSLGVPQ